MCHVLAGIYAARTPVQKNTSQEAAVTLTFPESRAHSLILWIREMFEEMFACGSLNYMLMYSGWTPGREQDQNLMSY